MPPPSHYIRFCKEISDATPFRVLPAELIQLYQAQNKTARTNRNFNTLFFFTLFQTKTL